MSRMWLHISLSEHHTINTAHPSYSSFIGFWFLNASSTKLPVCVTTQSLVCPPLTFLNYCSWTALLILSTLHQIQAYSNSDTSITKLIAFTLSPVSVLISWTTSHKMSDTLILSLPSKTKSWHFSPLNISVKYCCPSPQQSVQCLCVCVHLCVCARMHGVCVCVCVCVRAHVCVYIYIYI